MTTRTLAVCCEGFPALLAGGGAETALAVMDANTVRAVSPAARREGVRPGMRRRDAQARCPGLEVVASDESRDVRGFEQVMAVLESVAPRWEVSEPGRCSVPVRGPSRFFGGDRSVALRVRTHLGSALGSLGAGQPGVNGDGQPGVGDAVQPVGVAVADGPWAAAILAEQAARDLSARSSAPGGPPGGHGPGPRGFHGASGATPTGVCIVGPGETAAHLAPMPTRLLLSGGTFWKPRGELVQLVDVLERLGLVTLGRFAGLERTDVLARFGRCGMLAHDLVRGTESHQATLEDLPADLSVSAAFDPPAESVDQVGFMAKTLAAELHSRLGPRGLVCTRVLVMVETGLGERIERLWRDGGSIDAAGVAQRVRWQLEGWLKLRHTTDGQRGGVVRLELLADQVVPDDGRQLGLWGGEPATPERAERGIMRLVAMLGPDAVVVPRRGSGRSPRERYRMVPVGSAGPGSAGPGGVELGGTDRQGTDRQGTDRQGTDRQGTGPDGVEDLPDVEGLLDMEGLRDVEGSGTVDAPWPGALPKPSPVLVWPDPPTVEVRDSSGHMVGVNGRGVLSSAPVSIVVGGGAPSDVRSWAGPWCIDERWWDPTGHRRRARLQVLIDSGAHLLTLESGRWRLEATYD